MAVDPVPWFIQAPAEHSAEVARTLAYQAIGGKEGLARSGDLEVRPLPVPGGAVQVLPGAAGILNRAPGGAGQAYVGRVGSAVNVPIAATGSGSGRSDLVVFRVSDPQYGGATPPSAEEGPYIQLEVISGVPSNATRLQDLPGREADTAVTLARVDLPASTGTVTAGMITNVARVANPRREREQRVIFPTETLPEGRPLPSGSYASWPLQAAERPVVRVPEWASRVLITCSIQGARFSPPGSGQTTAGIRTSFGGSSGENTILVEDLASSAGRHFYQVTGDHAVTDAVRGTDQVIDVVAVRSAGSGIWYADYQTTVVVDYEFVEGD